MLLVLLETFAVVPWMHRSLVQQMLMISLMPEAMPLLPSLLRELQDKADLLLNVIVGNSTERNGAVAPRIYVKLKRKPSLAYPLDYRQNALETERIALVITAIQEERNRETAFTEGARVPASMDNGRQEKVAKTIRHYLHFLGNRNEDIPCQSWLYLHRLRQRDSHHPLLREP